MTRMQAVEQWNARTDAQVRRKYCRLMGWWEERPGGERHEWTTHEMVTMYHGEIEQEREQRRAEVSGWLDDD